MAHSRRDARPKRKRCNGLARERTTNIWAAIWWFPGKLPAAPVTTTALFLSRCLFISGRTSAVVLHKDRDHISVVECGRCIRPEGQWLFRDLRRLTYTSYSVNKNSNDSTPPEPGTLIPEQRVSRVPLPDWVKQQPYSVSTSAPNDAYVDNGLCRILYESQVNLRGSGFANCIRTVQRIVTRAGAEKAAQFAVEFDPSHQRVEVHFIRVVRSDAQIDHADARSLQILRRETNLERLALDGRLTATLLISDLRIDDVLDVSLTVYSNNPILEGKYTGWLGFNALVPWIEVYHRLVTPMNRKVSEKTFNEPPDCVIDTSHEIVETSWRLAGQSRLESEELTPPWLIQVPAVQFSEFSNWNQVAQLFLPYYGASALPAELSTELDRLTLEFTDPADRAAQWLRFVQRHLRYFALSLGEGGLVPRGTDEIWASRFGDCKDATRLFLAGAEKMGLDVCPALTSTTHGLALADFLPSPSIFNHCIARLRLNGKTYWLDPTMPTQQGRLEVIYQPHAGWALPLTADTQELERRQDDDPVHWRHSEGEFHLGPKPDSPASLKLQMDHYSFAADLLRHKIENEGHSKYAEQVLNDLREVWPDIVETAPLSWHDEQSDNRLTAIFSCEIRNAWRPVGHEERLGFKITATSVAAELSLLKKTQRRTEVFLGRPRKITWRARLRMPRPWGGTGWNQVLNAMSVRFVSNLVIQAREVCLEKEMLIGSWSLPASEAASYQSLVAKSRENVATIIARVTLGRVHSPGAGPFAFTPKRWAWTALWFLVWITYLVFTTLLSSAPPH